MKPEPDGIQEVWATLLVEELVRHGVTTFYASPGSRSTPLILAAGRNPRADVHMHIDERGSAFMALGHARMMGHAAAWLTTSGTAVANGHPAVVEARLEGLPMILLTADRPPELRETSANQTIRQVGLFGADVVWSFDVPVPTRSIPASFVLTTAAEAVRRSQEGPVHLNCMFREPLCSGTDGPAPEHGETGLLAAWKAGSAPWTELAPQHAASAQHAAARRALTDLTRLLAASQRPLLMLGRMPVPGRAPLPPSGDAASLANAAPPNWPVLADMASQYRSSDAETLGAVVACYDAILYDRERWPMLAPDLVLQLGRPPVSKRWQQFLEATRPQTVIVADSASGRIDPGHLVTHRWDVAPHALVAALAAHPPAGCQPPDQQWAARWQVLSRAASTHISDALSAAADAGTTVGAAAGAGTAREAEGLSEQACVRAAIAALQATTVGAEEAEPSASPLVLGNSMVVRHADTFAAVARAAPPVVVNRGASGIDGQVSTAIGAARAAGRRALLILGDVTLLHDLNALGAARDLTIVVINNDGGGIFSWLPVSAAEDVFTPLFAMPHGLGFKAAADLFGLLYEAPTTSNEVAQAVRRGMAADGGVLVEVRATRDATLAHQKQFLRRVSDALREVVPVS